MKVGLDFTPALYDRGVSRYTTNLVRALLEEKAMELTLYGSSFRGFQKLNSRAKKLISQAKTSNIARLHFQHLPPKLLSLAWRLGLNSITSQLPGLEVFHSWDWLQPPDKKLPLVSTIHDLAMLKYPDIANPSLLKAHQRSWQILREREAEIIAVSNATKNDVVEMLGIPAFRVHTIPEALPREFREINELLTDEQTEVIKKRLQLDRPYILFVGTREPRKNLLRLIEAWQPLSGDLDLIIAGAKGWDETDDQRLQQAGLRFLGQVSDQELNVLYAEAEVFAFPSLDEGFGLPILEAFYHGTPVVTSQATALIEVAGNAAELIDPQSPEDIRRGIELIINEQADAQRARLQRMIIRLHMFSWQNTAQQTMAVYRKAIDRHE
jgi:glycosyltransferase involved in cell wall biosynthesis